MTVCRLLRGTLILLFAFNTVTQASEQPVEVDVTPIVVPLSPTVADTLTNVKPAVPPCGEEQILQFRWSDAQLVQGGNTRPLHLEMKVVMGPSIAVDDSIHTILAGFTGMLSVGPEDSAITFELRQENYGVQFAKIIVRDGKAVASLPARFTRSGGGDPIFGRLAITCSVMTDRQSLQCDDVRFVLSEAIARHQRSSKTIEQVLAET